MTQENLSPHPPPDKKAGEHPEADEGGSVSWTISIPKSLAAIFEDRYSDLGLKRSTWFTQLARKDCGLGSAMKRKKPTEE
jgi:hypothetical protein